jgi:glycine dehydrogenase subunit 1
MPFIPHTDAETEEMLREIGVDNIEALFSEIPSSLKYQGPLNVPEGMTELELKKLMARKFSEDKLGACYIGAGAYEHHIPAAVSALIRRGEFLTAYTPYQAEASQGNLQLIYEYQTMIASLMGMEAANASVYDGASAVTEAVLMAVRLTKQKQKLILIPKTLHPAYRRTVKNIVRQQQIEIEEIDFDVSTGQISMDSLNQYANKEIVALVIPQPNFLGVLEEVDTLTDWAHAQEALAIAVVNPIATSLLKEPGKWGQIGADIACGEGQPLGIPLSSGGPYFGFMACKKKYVRQMPGRIVGRTVDINGKQGFTLTLQAREQHIRRAKATSNICTNQGLLVTAATIYMTLLGSTGLQQVAAASHAGAKWLLRNLTKNTSVRPSFSSPFFHEFVITLDRPVAGVLNKLAERGILAGYDLSEDYPELKHSFLVCVTETKSETDLIKYCQEFEKNLSEIRPLEALEQ